MSISTVKEIYEAFNEDEVNRYLADGWVIVSVVSGIREYGGKEEIGPVYVMGRLDAGLEVVSPLPTVGKSSMKS